MTSTPAAITQELIRLRNLQLISNMDCKPILTSTPDAISVAGAMAICVGAAVVGAGYGVVSGRGMLRKGAKFSAVSLAALCALWGAGNVIGYTRCSSRRSDAREQLSKMLDIAPPTLPTVKA